MCFTKQILGGERVPSFFRRRAHHSLSHVSSRAQQLQCDPQNILRIAIRHDDRKGKDKAQRL